MQLRDTGSVMVRMKISGHLQELPFGLLERALLAFQRCDEIRDAIRMQA
ncbi:hypothetical protein [Methylocystis hirsuta]|nr:hypothetical protein [Methylocystis hirsuta]